MKKKKGLGTSIWLKSLYCTFAYLIFMWLFGKDIDWIFTVGFYFGVTLMFYLFRELKGTP